MLLTKQLSPEQYARALESWTWLDIADKSPILSSLFGDVFFAGDEGYWFLDTIKGTLQRRWEDRDELQSTLSSGQGQDKYLLGGLAMAANESGLTLASAEVYDFAVPPVLGGEFTVENLITRDFVVSVHLAGQLIHQVKDLPPGTKITGFVFDEPPTHQV